MRSPRTRKVQATALGALLIAASATADGGLHRGVSNTDSPTPIAVDAAGWIGADSFAGLAAPGAADFSFAETRGSRLTAEQERRLAIALPATNPLRAEQGSVLGPDSRVRVSPTNTFPARAIALVIADREGATLGCTGFLIGPDTVATAGHCVHGGPDSTWHENVEVHPGRNGSKSPYGSCTARALYSVTGWTEHGREDFDYGAIKLRCKVGIATGWFGFWWQQATLAGLEEVLAGYPGDKATGQQWKGSGPVGASSSRQVFYAVDTAPGQSGSPIYTVDGAPEDRCSGSCAFGIHAYGIHGKGHHASKNHGTRISKSVFNNLVAWIKAP
jgi:glutamyl endopeptidase